MSNRVNPVQPTNAPVGRPTTIRASEWGIGGSEKRGLPSRTSVSDGTSSSTTSSAGSSKLANASVVEKQASRTGISSTAILITVGIQIFVSGVCTCVLFGLTWHDQAVAEDTLLCVAVFEWALLAFVGFSLCVPNKQGVQIFVLVIFVLAICAEGLFAATFVSSTYCFGFTCDLARVQLFRRTVIWSLLCGSALAHFVCVAMLVATFKTRKSQRHKGSVRPGKDASSSRHQRSYTASHGHTGSQRAVCGGSPPTFAALHTGRPFSPGPSDASSVPSPDHVLRDVVVMACRPAFQTSPARHNAALNPSSTGDFRRNPISTGKSTCEGETSWSRPVTPSTFRTEPIVTSSFESTPTLTDVPPAKSARDADCRDSLWPIAEILGGDKPLPSSSDSACVQDQSKNSLARWSYKSADLAHSWYKGRLTLEEAESIATRLNLNIFLYSRLSSEVVSNDQESRGNPLFLCSVPGSGRPRHYRVHTCTTASGDVYYYLTDFPDGPWFPMLKQLVHFYEACNARKAAP